MYNEKDWIEFLVETYNNLNKELFNNDIDYIHILTDSNGKVIIKNVYNDFYDIDLLPNMIIALNKATKEKRKHKLKIDTITRQMKDFLGEDDYNFFLNNVVSSKT